MPTHLPADEFLADYASGALSSGLSLLIASHLTQAPESRARVQEMEAVGGELLAVSENVDMSAGALEAVMSRLNGMDGPGVPEPQDPCTLPRPLVDAIGTRFDDIPWKFRLPGVASHDLDAFPDEKVTLLRARPGSTVPQHTHEGTEMTLVMQGIMLDDGIEYRRGDVAVNDEHDDHRPKIIGDETCYCLIVQQGDLRFTGRFSRLLNYIGE